MRGGTIGSDGQRRVGCSQGGTLWWTRHSCVRVAVRQTHLEA